MIKGRRRQARKLLSIESVLARIDEYSIFRYFLGIDFKLGKPFCNPLRSDRNPSANIKALNGGLYMTDFADAYWRGDCFDIIMKKEGWTLQETLEWINVSFGLGIGSKEKFHIRKAPVYKVPKIEDSKPAFIQFTGRRASKFNKLEQDYWNQYRVSFSLLEQENVFGVNTLYIDRQKFTLPKDQPVFAYFEPLIEKTKIYRPYANKQKKEWKWRSNIPFTFIQGLDKIQPCEQLIIAKSYKDRLCLLHCMENVVNVQSESFAAINDENLQKIKDLSQEQVVIFGSDIQGVESCKQVTSQLGMRYWNVPNTFLQEGINDPAEYTRKYGNDALCQLLKNKGIIQSLKQTA